MKAYFESCFARTESWTRRVKRWRDARMVMHREAAALPVVEKGLRRAPGCPHLAELIVALEQHHKKALTI